MEYSLIFFGWFFVAAMLAAVFVPWAMRKSDLLTSWNLFLLGSANFIGYDSILSGYGKYHFGTYSQEDYWKFISGAVVLYAALFLTYYWFKFPRRMAQKRLRRWPALSVPLVLICAAASLAGTALVVFTPQVQFVGQLSDNVGRAMCTLGVGIVFVAWWRNPQNPLLFALLIGLSILVPITSLLGTISRRFLLSVVLTFPICFYWLYLRYKRLALTAWPLATIVLLTIFVMAAHSSVRFSNQSKVRATDQSPFSAAVDIIKMLPAAIYRLEGMDLVLGSGAVDASLVAIGFYDRVMPQEPFYTFKYMISNPVPRAWWREKPEALGYKLPRDFGYWRRFSYVNWGPGIVGHGFHEGGYWALIMFGVVFGSAMRFFDELLVRQSDNPFLVACLGSASGQIVAFPRGDIGLFGVLILAAVFSMLVLRFIGRLLVGYSVYYPTDAEQRAMLEQGRAQEQGHAGVGQVPLTGQGQWYSTDLAG
jgi:hypothetical protein